MRKYMLRSYEDKGIDEADVRDDLVKRITFLVFNVKNPQLLYVICKFDSGRLPVYECRKMIKFSKI